jgi:hypothetical protein
MMAASLVGCSQSFESTRIQALRGTSLGLVQGRVQSGVEAVAGSHMYVYAAGVTGYGGSATSLLLADSSGSFPTSADGDGNYYITTDANGSFALDGDPTCDAGTELYLLSRGGSIGTAEPNAAISMLASLGPCPSSATVTSPTPMAVVNEVSTVAAAYALAGFAVGPTHIGSSGTTAAQTGIANAFANADNLYNLTSGAAGALAVTPAGNGLVPQALINTLANMLQACNGSESEASSQCALLFANAASSNGVEPTDTATAAINIAHSPGTGVGTLFGLQAMGAAVFQPSLSGAPSDFTIAVTFSGGGLSSPEFIAIDAAGDAWVPNTGGNTVTEISSTGAFLSGDQGFGGGGLTLPLGVAVDEMGNAWLVNGGSSGDVVEFSSVGTVLSGGGYGGGTLTLPEALAVDGLGNVWVASNQGTLTELSSSGTVLSSDPHVLGGPLTANQVVALDGTGHVFVLINDTNGGPGGSLAEFSSSGALIAAYNADRPLSFAMDGTGNAWVGSDWTFLNEIDGAGAVTTVQGGGVFASYGIAIDGGGNVWTTNPNIGGAPSPFHDSISEFSAEGVAISPGTGYVSGGLDIPWGGAIDGSGDVWVTNQMGNSVTELIGAAVPVVTPLSIGVRDNTLGTRP